MLDINAEKETKFTEVLDGKLSMEAINDPLEKKLAGASEDHVVHIEKKVGGIRTTLKDKQRGIRSCRSETKLDSKRNKAIQPCLRGLPEAIE
jgi:hypothetical protein